MVPGSDSGGVALGVTPEVPTPEPGTELSPRDEPFSPVLERPELESPRLEPLEPIPDEPESEPLDKEGEKMFPWLEL